jgi:hypothetical protein
LIEYDNTQTDGNHIHTVWRDSVTDFGGELVGSNRFGEDVLAEHYMNDHHLNDHHLKDHR